MDKRKLFSVVKLTLVRSPEEPRTAETTNQRPVYQKIARTKKRVSHLTEYPTDYYETILVKILIVSSKGCLL